MPAMFAKVFSTCTTEFTKGVEVSPTSLADPKPHISCRRRERAMQRFRRMRSLQKFAAVHLSVYSRFNQDRSFTIPDTFKLTRSAALAECREFGAARRTAIVVWLRLVRIRLTAPATTRIPQKTIPSSIQSSVRLLERNNVDCFAEAAQFVLSRVYSFVRDKSGKIAGRQNW